MRKEFISVIILAYNESKRIRPTLCRIDDYLRDHFEDFEIIVVNDGSSDNTEDIVLEACKKITSIKYITYQLNRGKGYALRQGVLNSTGDIVLISDADLSTPIEEYIDGFAYDVEILYIAKKLGYKIKEVPIKWINSPDSRVRPLRDSFQTALDILKIRLRRYK